MSISPQLLQVFSLMQFAIPFLSLFFARKSKAIALFHVGSTLTIFLVLFFLKSDVVVSAVFGGWTKYNGIQIKLNVESVYFILSSSIVFISVLLYSESKKYDDKFFFLLELVYGTLLNLFISNDLFNIYVCLELISLISYLLISSKLRNRQIWASLKYMILSAVGFNFYLLGIAIIYRTQGTLNIDLLLSSGKINDMALIFILTAFLIKSGAFMFSMWLPSAHSESEIPVSAILSAVIVKAGIFCLIRTKFMFEHSFLREYILVIGVVSLFAGIVLALLQKDIKLILAFSTMSQVGYILTGLYAGALEYAFCHALFKSSLFLTMGLLYDKFKTRNLEKIYSSDRRIHFSVLILFSISFLSIMGIPFLAGFAEKKLIFDNLPYYFKYISIAAAFGTVAYLGRIFIVILSKTSFKGFEKADTLKYISISIPSFFIILTGVKNTLNITPSFFEAGYFLILIPAGLFLGLIAIKKLPGFFPSSLFNISNIVKIYVLVIAFFVAVYRLM